MRQCRSEGGCTQMYVTVKLAWVIVAVIVGGLTWCAWRYPRSAMPMTIGIAALAALAMVVDL